jgi:threonine-phosphate decarboxylase
MGNTKINISTDNLISQVETVRFDLSMNPLGAPESVHRAVLNNINVLTQYPDRSYKRLKESISEYCHTDADNILIGSSSYEFIKLFIEFNSPKKALLLTPGAHYYEPLLKMNGCDITYYSIPEEDDFELDIADFISKLNEDLDMVFLSNPNAVTSKVIDSESLEFIARVCKGNDIFLVIDEKYMEFVKDNDICTAIPLTEEYDNIAVLRNTTKFFAVPGLRLAYTITSNVVFKKTMEITGFPYSINKLAETAGVEMFRDASYIKDTETLITTERNLVYSALSSRKTIKLYKPDANYILIKLLKEDITAQDVVDHCINRGLYIRSCSDITGLDNKYIRFCFMNPRQDDLLVNTILEIV